ncbi:MAG: PDZ domain-containing protein [Verrucomicrobia bacterium]|nr:PDZ domain-containing protein [Verrucomicrobiota bacterium]
MPFFSYSAVDAKGKTHQGTLEANNASDAAAAIKKQGMFPTNIAETAAENAKAKGKGFSFKLSLGAGGGGTGKVPAKILTVFTRQLSTLISAGLPLLRSLRTLSKQEKNPNLRKIMASLAESVEGGTTFSEALSQHPKAFNKLYVNMVKAGELGGVLEVVLTRLAEFAEKSQRIRGKVTSAMVYPLVVLTIAVGIVTFLMLFIVPKFEAIFKDMLGGRPLPFITQAIMDLSRFIQGNILLIVGVITVAVFAIRFALRLPGFSISVDEVLIVIEQLREQANGAERKEGFLGVGLAAREDGGQGAIITNVQPGSPADKAGILIDDVVLAVDGEPIDGQAGLVAAIRDAEPGQTVKIEIFRDGERLTFEATLIARTE